MNLARSTKCCSMAGSIPLFDSTRSSNNPRPVMERFFRSLKQWRTNPESFAEFNEAPLGVICDIEAFCYSRRLFQTPSYHTPNEFEEQQQVSLIAEKAQARIPRVVGERMHHCVRGKTKKEAERSTCTAPNGNGHA
jgi:hypothetical protein